MFEADFATTLHRGERASLSSPKIDSWRWTGWKRHLWPANIVRPGIDLYVYDLKTRRFVALMKVTNGGAFKYTSKRSFTQNVESLTKWTPSRHDPQWAKLPEGKRGKECTGIALRWRFIKSVDIPFDVRVDQFGWISLLDELSPTASDFGSKYPARTWVKQSRIVRDTRLIVYLKKLHDHKCQICGKTLDLLNGDAYSEGHHLRPVGSPHNGPDSADNILILCPNCHALCDLESIQLDASSLINAAGHVIDQSNIDYHNDRVARRLQKP